MSEEIIDLSNFRDTTGSRVPEGDYLVTVDGLDQGKSSAGDPMWTVYLLITGGEYDGEMLVERLTQSPKAMFRVVNFMKAVGQKVMRKRQKIDPQRFVGRKLRVSVADGEPFRGRIRSEVQGFERVAPAAGSSDASDDLDVLEEQAPAPAAETATAPAVPADTSDDIDVDLDDIDL